MPRHTAPPVAAKDLAGFKYFDRLTRLLERLHEVGTQRDRAHQRQFFFDQYASLILLYFFNPVLTSLRALHRASAIDKVQRVLGVPRVSLGALSEAAAVFDPERLHGVIRELAGELLPLEHGRDAEALRGLTAVDGSVLRALPSMAWALWTDDRHRGVKLHLHFEVFTAAPIEATVTPAASSEIAQLRATLQPDRLYVVDRGYLSYALYAAILQAKSSFVGRVQPSIAFHVAEERPIPTAAQAAGVIRDVVIDRLGTEHHTDPVQRNLRVVVVRRRPEQTRDGQAEEVWLLTDRLELAPDLVALAYRQRWTVELFFRWFKHVVGCRHWLTTDPRGVQIQVYLALIASLVVVRWSGCKPNIRTWEMLQWYLMGWATLDELERHFAAEHDRQARAAAKRAEQKVG